jgi:hypothetical protein
VTATTGFFRSIGGSVGVGVMGALFNVLTLPELSRLRARGVQPAALLDPKTLSSLAPDVRAEVQHMIARGLTWVFAAMLVVAVAQLLVSTLMPARRRADHVPKVTESMKAIAG